MASAFKFKSLFIDTETRKLVINGRDIPYNGLTSFSLVLDPKMGWILSAKRDVLAEVTEISKGVNCISGEGQHG